MINFQELEKVAEFKNGELNWLEGRDINAVYVILVGDEYYIGSSHYTYLRIGQHLKGLLEGDHHADKFQEKFNAVQEFDVYVLERGLKRADLKFVEMSYIKKYQPTLNSIGCKDGNGLGFKIKEAMNNRRVTSVWLSEEVGVSKVAISNILTGKNSPSVDNLLKIAEALNVSVTYLLGLEENDGGKDNSIPCPYCGKRIDVSLLKKEE